MASVTVSDPLLLPADALLCQQLQVLRLRVEGVCDGVLELTLESGVLERILACATQLSELAAGRAN